MAIDLDTYKAFEGVVKTNDSQTELECAKYLPAAVNLLLPSAPVSTEIGTEQRNFFGSSDFVLVAKLINDHNEPEDFAFIWELKAPQSYLFEFDDNRNRCRPTKELVKAENQLLHYYHQAEGDQQFRQRFGIMNWKNIRLGGIIIGRSFDRMLRGAETVGDNKKASTALQVRQQYLYPSTSIRILTWDRVLAFVEPDTNHSPSSH